MDAVTLPGLLLNHVEDPQPAFPHGMVTHEVPAPYIVAMPRFGRQTRGVPLSPCFMVFG